MITATSLEQARPEHFRALVVEDEMLLAMLLEDTRKHGPLDECGSHESGRGYRPVLAYVGFRNSYEQTRMVAHMRARPNAFR